MKRTVCFAAIMSVAAALHPVGAYAQEKVLNLFTWSDYTPQDLLDKFTAETGIKVNVDTYDSNEAMIAKLKAGGGGYDVVVPGGGAVGSMIADKLLLELDHSKLKNISNIKPAFADPEFDPGRKYSVPYLYGTTGFAYDKAKLPDLTESWKEVFEPREEAWGKIGMFKDPTYFYLAAAAYLGIDFCTENPADGQKILDMLLKQKPHVLVYSNEGNIDRIASGETIINMFGNGFFSRAQAKLPSLAYVVPVEGAPVWADNFSIAAGAPHVDNALAFLDFMMKPESAGAATNHNGYDNAITGAEAFVKDDLKNNPVVVMPPEIQARFKWERSCPPAAQDLRDKVWAQLFR